MAPIKRFYKTVSVEQHGDGFAVLLDSHAVRSPHRQPMLLPNSVLAEALAEEWRQQGESIEFAAMPLMRLAGYVVDSIGPEPQPARAEIVKYAGSDLLCYRAAHPAALVTRQAEAWDPLIARYSAELGIRFRLATGIVHVPQDAADLSRFARLANELTDFALAGVHAVTTLTGSALVAIALRRGWLEATTAWQISLVDEDFQAEQWGIDQEALQRRQTQFADFGAALLALTTTLDRAQDGD